MILRTLAVALALMALAASVLRPVIAWIASDERTAWGCVAAMVIVGLVFVMEGKDRR